MTHLGRTSNRFPSPFRPVKAALHFVCIVYVGKKERRQKASCVVVVSS